MRRRVPLILVLLVALASCSDDDGAAADVDARSCTAVAVTDRPLRVAATVSPITSIVATLTAGTDTEVTGIVPEGTNSHTFEPSPRHAAVLDDADVVFLNGLFLEEPTRALADANARDGATICELGTTVLARDDYRYDFSFPESGGRPNPHLWTDPQLVAQYAALATEVLATADPSDAERYRSNRAAFEVQIEQLDDALHEATASIPPEDRLLLTYHDAYAYVADTYGWTVVGAIQPSSFGEPTPRDVARLIEQIDDLGVRAVFGSEVFPSPVLEQIAAESGATYVDDLRDDDLPGAPGDPEHSWLGLMRFNYVTLVEALGGDASALHVLDLTPIGDDTATYPQ